MTDTLISDLPEEKRAPGRALRVTMRTLHIISFSVFFGGLWFGVQQAELMPWLYASVFTGAALMALELRKGLDWFLQLAGGVTLIKLALLCLVPVFPDYNRFLLLLAVGLSSVGSHMPARLRHFNYIKGSSI
ncbi:MAG: hypothetical protein PHV36_11445 [Elusimicrobiales bacterium]|nr:hypothetical protein [Elusimicrobiales bacterium]